MVLCGLSLSGSTWVASACTTGAPVSFPGSASDLVQRKLPYWCNTADPASRSHIISRYASVVPEKILRWTQMPSLSVWDDVIWLLKPRGLKPGHLLTTSECWFDWVFIQSARVCCARGSHLAAPPCPQCMSRVDQGLLKTPRPRDINKPASDSSPDGHIGAILIMATADMNTTSTENNTWVSHHWCSTVT